VLDDLEERCDISEATIARVFREMLSGICFLHEQHIIHRDIKLDNFLLGGADGQTVKLGDFGLATRFSHRLTGNCGTSAYKAPEMLQGQIYTEQVDVWSFGVCAYLVLFGDFPYMPDDKGGFETWGKAAEESIRKGYPHPEFSRVPLAVVGCLDSQPSAAALSFAKKALVRTPRERWSAKEALTHDFVRMDSSGHSAAAEQPSPALKAAIGFARMRTKEFGHNPVDPTVQRSLDELLGRLQGADRGTTAVGGALIREKKRHFSETDSQDLQSLASKASNRFDKSHARLLKSGTHCGTLTVSAVDFFNCDVSTATPTPEESDSDTGEDQDADGPSSLPCEAVELPHTLTN